jgi:hypothetical protein
MAFLARRVPLSSSSFALVSLSFLVLACGGALSPERGSEAPSDGAPANPLPAASGSAAAAVEATHRVAGIVDPTRDGMVAFALKVPVGWKMTQSFTRTWEGAVSTPQVHLTLAAPDGSAHIEYRPIRVHTWSEGPMTEQLRAQKRSWGMDPRMSENELAPTSGSAYARDVMLPILAQEGSTITNVRNPQDAPEERTGSEVKRRGSIDGTLPDGQQVRVETRLRLMMQQGGSDTYITWGAVPSITRTTGDLEVAHTHTRIAQDSIVRNPAWEKLENEDAAKGLQANSDASRQQHEATMNQIQQNTNAMTAAHNQRMADIQRQGDANTARYQERMADMDRDFAAWQDQSASQDRQHEYTIDTIRGEHKYVDPTTGQTVKVDGGYDNVYRANTGADLQGTTILATDAPLDPHQVDWVQLQKLSQAEY